jgi:hypothetical protein
LDESVNDRNAVEKIDTHAAVAGHFQTPALVFGMFSFNTPTTPNKSF